MSASNTETWAAANREHWLSEAVRKLDAAVFAPLGFSLPVEQVRVSVGFPSTGARSQRVGECWYSHTSQDGSLAIFVSPSLDDAVRVLDVLTHELVHAYLDDATAKHGPRFRKVATAVGLTGRMTSTVAGFELAAALTELARQLGPYPHAALSAANRGTPKQRTRMLKVECPEDGYVVRTTRKWLDQGAPFCPDGHEMREA